MDIQSTDRPELFSEDISDYVAQLQLHMALQARNLVPTLTNSTVTDSRHQMLQETQGDRREVGIPSIFIRYFVISLMSLQFRLSFT